MNQNQGKKFIDQVAASRPKHDKLWLPEDKRNESPFKEKTSVGRVPVQFPRPTLEKPVQYKARGPFATFEDEMRSSVYSVMNRR